ncbi:hypothetical protein L2E82_25413 [Cichorium intybus]|uniref:Uncharacterized protein n=1 Tax=Cichorium intybus TaxID=13427 RepID=A0ACB9E3K0_CICIN|nr:hypothetical protein L2E82_25413 [Cichorium intybus]
MGRKRSFKEHFLKCGGYGDVNSAKPHPPQNMDCGEKTNPNEASLVHGWQKRHMKNGKWCNQKAEDDYVSDIQLMQ